MTQTVSTVPMDRRRLLLAAGVAGGAMALDPAHAVASVAGAAGPRTSVTASIPATPPLGEWTQTGFIERAGGRIQWAAMGMERADVPTLVVMPKLGGWIADWRDVARLLAPRFRVIAIDPPGHGGSAMASKAPYIQTLPESAAMVRAALGTLGVERYSLAGNSLGGCIGTIMAALFPDEVETITLISVALADRMDAAGLAAYDARDQDYDAQGYPVERSVQMMAQRFGTTPEINAEQNASRAAAGLWIRPSERGVFTCGITDYLPRVAARALLVYGNGNRGVYQIYREKALSLMPNASSIDVDGAGAFLHQQKPEVAARLLAGVLEKGR